MSSCHSTINATRNVGSERERKRALVDGKKTVNEEEKIIGLFLSKDLAVGRLWLIADI